MVGVLPLTQWLGLGNQSEDVRGKHSLDIWGIDGVFHWEELELNFDLPDVCEVCALTQHVDIPQVRRDFRSDLSLVGDVYSHRSTLSAVLYTGLFMSRDTSVCNAL